MPSQETLIKAYNGLYSNRERFDSIDFKKQKQTRSAFLGYMNKLKKLKKTPFKSFLDIGGGLGYYSEAAQNCGLTVTLLDLDQQSLQFAKAKLDVQDTFHGGIEEFAAKGLTFDVVFLRHVIEHVPDPNSLISNARKCLKPDGILIIETPNNKSLEIAFRPRILLSTIRNHKKRYPNDSAWKYIRKRIYAIRPPIHLLTFSNNNLEQLLIKNGLDPMVTFNNLIGDPTYWPNEKKSDLRLLFKGLISGSFKLILFGISDIILYPIRILLNSCGYSSGICIYAQAHTNHVD